RLMLTPKLWTQHRIGLNERFEWGWERARHRSITYWPMSALGHKQTCAVQNVMSALPPKATLNAFIRMSAWDMNDIDIGQA
ncbi:MAG: hypothetical protein WCF62_23420, partial [Pseudolabrys sp.]